MTCLHLLFKTYFKFGSAPAIFLPHHCHLWVPVDKIHHCSVRTHETKLYEITVNCQLEIHELRPFNLRTSLTKNERENFKTLPSFLVSLISI